MSEPEQACERALVREAIDGALARLTYRQREIIRLRYGLAGPELTYEEIGRVFRVTRERVRQIVNRAMRMLCHGSISRVLVGALDSVDAFASDYREWPKDALPEDDGCYEFMRAEREYTARGQHMIPWGQIADCAWMSEMKYPQREITRRTGLGLAKITYRLAIADEQRGNSTKPHYRRDV